MPFGESQATKPHVNGGSLAGMRAKSVGRASMTVGIRIGWYSARRGGHRLTSHGCDWSGNAFTAILKPLLKAGVHTTQDEVKE